MNCEYKTENGCTAPIAANCSDACIIKELKAEIKSLEQDIEELTTELELVASQNKALKKQHQDFLKQISLVD